MIRLKNVTRLLGGGNLFPKIYNIQDLRSLYRCWETENFCNKFFIIKPFNIDEKLRFET